jgi:hypothetical protein
MKEEDRESKELIPAEQTSLGLPVDVSGIRAFAASATTDRADFLKCSGKTGRVTYGKLEEELPDNARLAVLIGQTQTGYIDWQDGVVATESWLSINKYSEMPELRKGLGKLDSALWTDRDPRGRPKDPFHESVKTPMVWIQERKPLVFTASNDGGCNAIKSLSKKCLDEAQSGCVPVVEIEVKSYQHSIRTIGEVFYPVFRIKEWMSAQNVLCILKGEAVADGNLQVTAKRAAAKQTKVKRR